MKIIINGRFLTHSVTGVERYAREMLLELDRLALPGEFTLAIPPEAKDVPDYQNIKAVRVGRLHNRLWEHLSFPRYVRKHRAVPLNLCNVAPLPLPGIVCIHDMKIRAVPQYFSKQFLFWYRILNHNAARRADMILTDSEFSKSEIMKYYRVDSKRIQVIPCGYQHYERIVCDEGALEKYGLERDGYYFSLSSLEPNKNFKWIAMAAKQHPERIFAVAGAVNEQIFADGLGFSCPENMKLLGYVSDEEAKTLLRDCRAFLFPTFYEGFGLPPLEAICAGAKHVVVSDTEVMHEIFRDCVSYIDPNRTDNIQIDELLRDDQDNRRVLALYSWEQSAGRLLQLLRRNE